MTKSSENGSILNCDRLLRFEPQIQRRYEAENSHLRLRALRHNIIVGLAFYNMYNLTAITLMPDIFWLSVFLRVAVVTTGSLGIVWLLGRIAPIKRERLILAGMINALLVPVFLFWFTRAPLGNYSFGELPLQLIFGNMVLALRFRYALAFTGFFFASTAVAALSKPGIAPELITPLVLQSLTACAFSIYANYQIELRRCRDYLESLQARLRSEQAELSEQRYRDLSLTDPLTGLANRRALDQRLDELFRSPQPKAALMIDVDYFKNFNDTKGHTRGDRVLLEIAQCLTRVVTTFSDGTVEHAWCARFGGEEFIVVAEIDDAAAQTLAQAVITGVREANIAHPARPDGIKHVTVSVGVAIAAVPERLQPIDLLVSADTALYEAKRLGRDQAVSSRFWPRAGTVAKLRRGTTLGIGPF